MKFRTLPSLKPLHCVLFAVALAAAAPAWAVSNPKAARYYEDALTRYEKRDMAGAVIQLKNALQIDQSMLPVHLLLGKVLLAQFDVAAAEAAFEQALKLGANRAEVVVPLARAVMLQGRPKDVLEQQRFALAGLPGATQMSLNVIRSQAASDIGDARLAMKSVDDARAIDPLSPEPWLAEIPIRIRARQFKEARAAVDKALALSPNSAEAFYLSGSLAHVQGDRAAALAAYTRALAVDKVHVEALVARAGLLVDMGRTNEAVVDLDTLRTAAEGEPRAAYLRAVLAREKGDGKAAALALQEITGLIDPVPVEFLRYRSQLLLLNGLSHFDLGEREKAKAYLEMFNRVQPNTPVTKLLAQVYVAEKNLDRAVEALDAYLRNQPGDSQALALLASVHLAQGRHARAASLMQEALRSRDAPEFHTVLGMSLARAGQATNAVAQFEQAYKKDPAQVHAAVALVGLYLQSQQSAKALSMAQALVTRDPKNPGYENLLGLAKVQAKDLPGARAAYERALALDPTLITAQLNLARLETAAKAYDRAAARLGEVLKVEDRNVEAMVEMATISELRGQPDETLRWLQRAADLSAPTQVRAGLALIDLHMRNSRFVPALEVAKALNVKAPDNLLVLLALARTQLAVSDTAAARSALTSATRLADYEAPVQVEIASLQILAQNLPGAVYSLEKALSTAPDLLAAQALMAEVEARQGDYARSDQRLRQIIQKYPKLAIGHSIMGASLVARGQIPAAIESYKRAHQAEPSSQTLLRLYLTMQSQDMAGAQKLAEQWVASHATDRAVRTAVAENQVRRGDFAAARKSYEALVRLAPGDAAAVNNLANVQLRLKDPAALATAEKALALNPANANAIDTVGWAAFAAGQDERALQLLRDARLRDPANPAIRYHLAAVLAKAGRRAEALTEIDAALRSSAGFDARADAQRLQTTLK